MSERINVLKTYKIFIGGKFPRTESGRYYQPKINGNPIGNICLSSRKDVKNAVVAARSAFEKWSSASAFNRSQILYRIAEMIEARKAQFIEELIIQGETKKSAENEVDLSIDRVIYFAGWADKINQVFGSVNPVATSHFNFSMLEPTGVVGVVAPENYSLLGLISSICPVIVSGNTSVVLTSESKPLCGVTLAEVLVTSDIPAGVVNVLTGKRSETVPHLGKHMDVNAVYLADSDSSFKNVLRADAVDNLKRIIVGKHSNLYAKELETPYIITSFMETKTTWHPIEIISGSGSGY
jgi:acyl-CoA reductase-like NAD-dependent aldehyde dehydrogenase